MSVKDFRRGLEAGARPYEDKYVQITGAVNRIAADGRKQWNIIKAQQDDLIDTIESMDKKRLFDLNTQFDVKNLADHEKELLVAILFDLSSDESNANQQAYIRSVKKYLNIKNPQTSIDISVVENIDTVPAQKAILQACMEFLFLAKETPDFFNEYGGLFDAFQFNQKTKLGIWENVLQIYRATGAQGLAEKYGYVPVEEGNAKKLINNIPITTEECVIDQFLDIPPGEEKVLTAKEITLLEDIHCGGKLILDHCIITYNGDDIKGQIQIEENASVVLSHCSIIGNNNDKRTERYDKRFIIGKDKTSRLRIENSLFSECLNFAIDVHANLKDSIIQYTKLSSGAATGFLKAAYESDSSIDGCLIETNEEAGETYLGIYDIGTITKCSYKNMKSCINDAVKVEKCDFTNCSDVISGSYRGSANISECLFLHCNNVIRSIGTDSQVTHCQFVECDGTLIDGMHGNIKIEYCEFYNVQERADISFMLTKEYGSAYIRHCTFDGINNPRFIQCSFDKELSVFSKKVRGLYIEDCNFKHCVNGVILRQNTRYNYDDITVDVSNCSGLDSHEGGKAENVPVRHDTSTGEPIGSRLDETAIGVYKA
jgi:hypothetical protein